MALASKDIGFGDGVGRNDIDLVTKNKKNDIHHTQNPYASFGWW
jgi:hypothetical protein